MDSEDSRTEGSMAIGRRQLLHLAAGAGLVTVIAACSSTSSSSNGPLASNGSPTSGAAPPRRHVTPQAMTVDQPGFYDPPDPLPQGHHGDLIRHQPIAKPVKGVAWHRVMYLSESVDGKPTVVTGVVTVPTGPAPAGGWRLVTHGHGSTGLATSDAPSIGLDGDRSLAIEIVFLSGLAPKHGAVIASTDYEGLGGPGHHPFLVGVSEARGVLDIALAARQLPGLTLRHETAIAGYSQGGHAVLWANQIAATWTPQLKVLGTMAGAPASELLAMVRRATGEVPITVGMIGGLAGAYAQARPKKILTAHGLELLDILWNHPDATSVPKDDSPLYLSPPATTQPWEGLWKQNTPGSTKADTPLLIIHSAEDENVPIGDSAVLLKRLCNAGQMAERRVLPHGGHVAAAVPAYEQAFTWFEGLERGVAPVSSCGT